MLSAPSFVANSVPLTTRRRRWNDFPGQILAAIMAVAAVAPIVKTLL